MDDQFNIFGVSEEMLSQKLMRADPFPSSRTQMFPPNPVNTILGWVITAHQEGKSVIYLCVDGLLPDDHSWNIDYQQALCIKTMDLASECYREILANPSLPEGYIEECVEFKIRPLMLGPEVKV